MHRSFLALALLPLLLPVSNDSQAGQAEAPRALPAALQALEGDWTLTQRFQWQGQWFEETGSAQRIALLGGRYLREELSDANGRVTALRFWACDEAKQRMQLVWMDEDSPLPTIFDGVLEDSAARSGPGGLPRDVRLHAQERFPWAAEPQSVELSVALPAPDDASKAHGLVLRIPDGEFAGTLFEASYARP